MIDAFLLHSIPRRRSSGGLIYGASSSARISFPRQLFANIPETHRNPVSSSTQQTDRPILFSVHPSVSSPGPSHHLIYGVISNEEGVSLSPRHPNFSISQKSSRRSTAVSSASETGQITERTGSMKSKGAITTVSLTSSLSLHKPVQDNKIEANFGKGYASPATSNALRL